MIRRTLCVEPQVVADTMHISAKAFNYLEQGYGYPRIEMLKRFCEALNVQLNFLLADDVPVTIENISRYGNKSFGQLITTI
jgi:transcriptional regulator with XRE-family HTH domain